MLLLTLRYYASGNFLITVADYCGVNVMTASRTVKRVSKALAKLYSKFIKMPKVTELKSNANAFYNIAKFPKVLGSIDCTHIRIQSPGGNNAELYRNRKGYFSFNVQVAICNAHLKIMDIVCRWPGSAHDSNIFNNSNIKAKLENGEFQDYYLLGDSGYGIKPYLMTPLSNPVTHAEILYNESQIRTRNTIERCFGVLKRRFPILSLGMRVSIDTSMAIIVACAVLHNIAIKYKVEEP
ncbi:putative nuclease HARBI1 [Lucilia sericata]|uniref:putative nuclease HARBI1 n=1 Tax=Lucilia sericata TaxID=13632 RepID=UPI0018A82EE0|nr:putative nuclease HARBI1 [Lucilia sericata]XP_037810621.1 putative nuclease HARBI1 [Lucilia sericata]